MPGTGIEPVRLAARDFKSLVSTNFTIRALLKQQVIKSATYKRMHTMHTNAHETAHKTATDC